MKQFSLGNNTMKHDSALTWFTNHTNHTTDNGFIKSGYSTGIPRYNINSYSKQFSHMINSIELRDYQKVVIEQTDKHTKGIVSLPTGAGKTFCQAEIIHKDIKNNPGFRIYVVNSPRILLSYQLLKEIFQVLTIYGVESRYMMVHSSNNIDSKEHEDWITEIENNEKSLISNFEAQSQLWKELTGLDQLETTGRPSVPYSQIMCGLSSDSIMDMLIKAYTNDTPIVLVSTYNSCEQIQIAINRIVREIDTFPGINIVLNDEAQYLVQEQFHHSLYTLEAERKYFFTATMIDTASERGFGMNNKELYGDVIYHMTPAMAIMKGLIIRPRIHIVSTKNVYEKEDFDKCLPEIIKDCFDKHAEQLTINPKLLIAVRGLPQIKLFITSDTAKVLMNSGVIIYGAASVDPDKNSKDISFYTRNNILIKSKNDFLKQLKEEGKNPELKLIVLHYDTLSEGIDIDGLTGLLPLRSLKKSKFLQNFGRISRVFKQDKALLFNGSSKDTQNAITATDIHQMYKPYAWIILPEILHGDSDEVENLKYMIAELRSFDLVIEDIISDKLPGGNNKIDPELPALNDDGSAKKLSINSIEELFHEIEEEEKTMLFKKQCEAEAKLPKINRLDKYKNK